jgi:hypothetical protein
METKPATAIATTESNSNINDQDMPDREASVEEPPKKSKKQKAAEPPSFARTNRIDGIQKWVLEVTALKNEILRYYQDQFSLSDISRAITSQLSLLVEISKELLYSGIPEQTIELYHTYSSMLENICKDSNDIYCQVLRPDARLVIVTTRAYIKVNDVLGAIRLLHSSSRLGVVFDSESKSQIISELALSSPQGLKAALHLRTSMLSRNESINTNACAAILSGICEHGLQPKTLDRTLLSDSLVVETYLLEDDSLLADSFHLPAEKAYELANEILSYHVDSRKGKAKRTHKVMREFFRLLFRLSQPVASEVDLNLVDDDQANRELQSKYGLSMVFDAMEDYDIDWDIHIADILIEGCLSLGDHANIMNILQTMRQKQIPLRTSTCNSLLKQYVVNTDAENAYRFYVDVMKDSELCKPNADSYSLLLDSCLQSSRGLYYARLVLADLIKNNLMDKKAWDSLIKLTMLEDKSMFSILKQYPTSQHQPNDETFLAAIDAASLSSSLAGNENKHILDAAQLYRYLCRAASYRQRYIAASTASANTSAIGSLVDFVQDPNSRYIAMSDNELWQLHLPSPSYPITMSLLHLLRAHNLGAEAFDILQLYLKQQSSNEPPAELFAIAMETSINANDPRRAFEVFQLYESYYPIASSPSSSANETLSSSDLSSFNRHYPSRRIYRNLIKAFGLNEDFPSAMGVFKEMCQYHLPDIESLHSLLQLSLASPQDLRNIVTLLDQLADDPKINLEVYSKDIIMQGFPDSISLGKALSSMEKRALAVTSSLPVYTSISVLNVLVQAIRKDASLQSLVAALSYLGSAGIAPDSETMTYFRMGAESLPTEGSPNSRHLIRTLLPHRERVRSLMDMDIPAGLEPDLRMINDLISSSRSESYRGVRFGERLQRYHESGIDEYETVVKAFREAISEESYFDKDQLNDDADRAVDWSMVREVTGGESEGSGEVLVLLDDFATKPKKLWTISARSIASDKMEVLASDLSADLFSQGQGKYDVRPNDQLNGKGNVRAPRDIDDEDDDAIILASSSRVDGSRGRERGRPSDRGPGGGNRKRTTSPSSAYRYDNRAPSSRVSPRVANAKRRVGVAPSAPSTSASSEKSVGKVWRRAST